MDRIVLPVAGMVETRHLAARCKAVLAVVVMVIDHHDLARRPVEGAEVEARPDVVGMAPVKAHAHAVAHRMMPVVRPIARPAPVGVDHARVVVRHVDHPRAGRLDVDVLALANDLHAVVAAQVTLRISLRAQVLDRGDHLFFLQQEGIAEILRPLQVLVHAAEQLGESHQRLHAGIPVLILHRGHGILAAQARMFARPARRLDHLQRIGRGDQHVRKHAVGIQRDRRQHRVQLGLAEIVVVGLHLPGGTTANRQQKGENQRRERFHVISSLRHSAPRGAFVPRPA